MSPVIVIILAAGEGRRMGRLTQGLPKCLVPVHGVPLLYRSLEGVQKASLHDVCDVCIVAGYCSERLRGQVRSLPFDGNVHLCLNPRFASTNNAISLQIALEAHPDQSFILMDGDLLFDEVLLRRLLLDSRPDLMVVEEGRGQLNEEAMKVVVDPANHQIQVIGKNIPLHRASGEFIGMAKFSKAWSAKLWEALNLLASDKVSQNLYYEDMIQKLIPSSPPLYALPVNGLRWSEIDTFEDLQQAEELWSREGKRMRPSTEDRRMHRRPLQG